MTTTAALRRSTAEKLILTVDVEDYFQVSGFESSIHRSDWDAQPCRVEQNTDKLLDLFSEANAKATFFLLGWVAAKFPPLVRRIATAGHEIASHGYWHRLVYSQSREDFREDIRRSRKVIEDAAGISVTAYRAPSFSITEKSEWALEILAEEGFTLDSSIFPMHHDRYGMPNSSPKAHIRNTSSGEILELPPSVWQTPLKGVPVGGGYFRLFPRWLTQRAINGALKANHYAMIYIHPWEIDPDQPRIQNVGRLSAFRHYVGLRRTLPRLRYLIENYTCVPINDAIKHIKFSQ